jgi:hypothetical protein
MWQDPCSKEEPETVATSRTEESLGGSNTIISNTLKALHIATRQVQHLKILEFLWLD